MSHHTRFDQRANAAAARRGPCPICGGKYYAPWGRPFCRMDCPDNPMNRRTARQDAEDTAVEAALADPSQEIGEEHAGSFDG